MGNQARTRYYDHLSMNAIHLNWALKLRQSFGKNVTEFSNVLEWGDKCLTPFFFLIIFPKEKKSSSLFSSLYINMQNRAMFSHIG